jgi:phosphate transport system permease protein
MSHIALTQQPWAVRDRRTVTQALSVHIATPFIAAALVAVSPIAGKSGFFITWFFLHLITATLLGRFGRKRKSVANSIIEVGLISSVVVLLGAAGSVLAPVFINGISAFRMSLLTQDAATVESGSELSLGGLGHAIVGSIIIVGLASLIAVPVGILAALYVTEVRGRLTPFVRFFVQAMSGVPSIVAGLFVYAALIVSGIVQFSGFAGSIALAILMLPTVARTAEEVLLLVPDDLRTAALALGAPQRRVVFKVVLPAARSGLITAGILGVARVAGETAPLLLTAFGSTAFNYNPFSDSMSALPLYIFTQMLLGTDNDVARAWVACLVLMGMVGVLFAIARIASSRLKRL